MKTPLALVDRKLTFVRSGSYFSANTGSLLIIFADRNNLLLTNSIILQLFEPESLEKEDSESDWGLSCPFFECNIVRLEFEAGGW